MEETIREIQNDLKNLKRLVEEMKSERDKKRHTKKKRVRVLSMIKAKEWIVRTLKKEGLAYKSVEKLCPAIDSKDRPANTWPNYGKPYFEILPISGEQDEVLTFFASYYRIDLALKLLDRLPDDYNFELAKERAGEQYIDIVTAIERRCNKTA